MVWIWKQIALNFLFPLFSVYTYNIISDNIQGSLLVYYSTIMLLFKIRNAMLQDSSLDRFQILFVSRRITELCTTVTNHPV